MPDEAGPRAAGDPAGEGSGSGSGAGGGNSPGTGSGNGPGSGPGAGAGTGAGSGPGAGTGTGTGTGPGAGLSVTARLTIPLDEIVLRTSRSSGPGGQHANVTASRVEAVFDVAASETLSDAQRRRLLAREGGRIVAVAQDARGQSRNRRLALERLAARIAAGLVVPRKRRATKPTAASRERRLQSKRRASERKAARRPPEPD